MMARLAWYAIILLIAGVTAVVQIDRQSDSMPGLAWAVPPPFRNFAQTRLAANAIAGPDADLALSETERLVARRPLPGEYLTLLAVAQAKAGQEEAAALTIQIAAQRGWRDPVAQEAMLRLALTAGDQPEAARRYMALFLRSSTPDALLRELGPAVLNDAQGSGTATVIDIVSGTDRWHDQFLRRGPRVMPPDAFATITAGSLLEGATFYCPTLGRAIAAIERRDAAAANRMAIAAGGPCPRLAPKGSFPL